MNEMWFLSEKMHDSALQKPPVKTYRYLCRCRLRRDIKLPPKKSIIDFLITTIKTGFLLWNVSPVHSTSKKGRSAAGPAWGAGKRSSSSTRPPAGRTLSHLTLCQSTERTARVGILKQNAKSRFSGIPGSEVRANKVAWNRLRFDIRQLHFLKICTYTPFWVNS